MTFNLFKNGHAARRFFMAMALGAVCVHAASENGFVAIPNPTNAVQLRFYTNASPDASHLVNTFDIEASGVLLLKSPGGKELKDWFATSPSNESIHNILINGKGPVLNPSNSIAQIECVRGSNWNYTLFDASAAYGGMLQTFKRGILYVEPDLFVIYDHLEASNKVDFKTILHPPSCTTVDPVWHDLRVEFPEAALRIHAPEKQNRLREWAPIKSPADEVLQGTTTMVLSPSNSMEQIDLITVFAVRNGTNKQDLAFRLLQSPTAIGARIHRNGYPTLVAFKKEDASGEITLTGFPFTGLVGVDVFQSKRKTSNK
jgi:hypothetical protein